MGVVAGYLDPVLYVQQSDLTHKAKQKKKLSF